jgi:hypothetical protein
MITKTGSAHPALDKITRVTPKRDVPRCGVVAAGLAVGVTVWVVAELAEDPGAEHGA